MKCIDDEIPFEIPQGWEWARIRDISRSYIGLTYSPADVYPNGPIVLRSSNIKDGKLHLDDIVRVKASVPEKLWVEKNDIIICARNGSKKLVGKSAIIPEVSEPMTFGAFMAICKTSLWKYVFCFLQSDLFFSQLREVSGTTTINQLTQNNFNGFLIPIPPYSEQERIFEQLNAILPLIETYSKQQEYIDAINNSIRDRLKKSILQEAIKGRLVPQIAEEGTAEDLLAKIRTEKQKLLKEGKLKKKDITDSIIFKGDDNKYYERIDGNLLDISDEVPFDLPDSWVWARLSSVCNMFTGNSISEKDKSTYFTGVSGMQYIGTKDVRFDNSIDYKNGIAIPDTFLPNFKIAPSESVLMCIEGGSAGRKVGQTDRDVCFGNKLCCFSSFGVYQRYLYYYIQSPSFVESFQKNKTGIIGGVSVNSLKNLLIAIPPIKEQVRIAQHVAEILSFL